MFFFITQFIVHSLMFVFQRPIDQLVTSRCFFFVNLWLCERWNYVSRTGVEERAPPPLAEDGSGTTDTVDPMIPCPIGHGTMLMFVYICIIIYLNIHDLVMSSNFVGLNT